MPHNDNADCLEPDDLLNAIENVRADLDNLVTIMSIAPNDIRLPFGWSWNDFTMELMTHHVAMRGITPLEALPRAQAFVARMREANKR